MVLGLLARHADWRLFEGSEAAAAAADREEAAAEVASRAAGGGEAGAEGDGYSLGALFADTLF